MHLFARNSGAQRAWLSSLGAIVALVGLLAVGTMDSATMTRVDLTVVASLHAHAIEPVTAASLAVTALGSTQYALAALAIAVALFAAWRHWRGLLTVALAVAMAQGAVALVKLLVARPRPPDADAIIDPSGFSFPSGHAATAMALYATLAFVIGRRARGPARVAVYAAAVVLIVAIGVTRVYLGAHYPSDVAAGWLTGAAVAMAAGALALRLPAGHAARYAGGA